MRRPWILLAAIVASLLLAGHVLRGAMRVALPPITMWGDSQTAPGSGYGDRLAALMPGRRTYNLGIGGQRLEMIAARMGAVPVTLRRPIVLPASGAVGFSADDLSIDLLRVPSGSLSLRVSVSGVPATLNYRAGPDPKHGIYALARSVPADHPMKIEPGAQLIALSGTVDGGDPGGAEPLEALLKGVVIVRGGRNNLNDPAYDITQGLDLVGRLVARAERRTRRIIILGQMLGYGDLPASLGGGSPGAERSAAVLALQARWNEELGRRFPAYFADVQAFHVAHGGGEGVTLPGRDGPVRLTILTKTAKLPVLRDGVHENDVGQRQTAELLRGIIEERRY